jgi:DNA-binding transcriptional regulator YiaG
MESLYSTGSTVSTPANFTKDLNPRVQSGWTSDTIRIARKAKRMTQSELAFALGCRQQTISEWELGMYSPKNAYQQLLNQFFAKDGTRAQEELSEPPPVTSAAVPVGDRHRRKDDAFLVTLDQLEGMIAYMRANELVEMKISFQQAQATFSMFGLTDLIPEGDQATQA